MHENFLIKVKIKEIKYKKPKNSLLNCLKKKINYNLTFYFPIIIKYKKKIISI